MNGSICRLGPCHSRSVLGIHANFTSTRAITTSSMLCNRKRHPLADVHKRTWDNVRFEKRQTPSNLALKFFDFHYPPLFGDVYPSIRLALLSDRKYVAVLNNLLENSNEIADQLSNEGGFEVMSLLRQQSVKKLAKRGLVFDQDVRDFLRDKAESQDNVPHLDMRTQPEADNPITKRDASALSDFMPVTKVKLASDVDDDHNMARHNEEYRREMSKRLGIKRRVWSDEFELHSVPDIAPVYPENLRIFAKSTSDVTRFTHFPVMDSGHHGWYLVNGASLLPILAMNLRPGDRVLDMCAAPGGKSLITLLTSLPGKLDCNDMKMQRLNEMRNMLMMYMPETGGHREKVTLLRRDASNADNWILPEEEKYDKILVDVPCNTDRDSLISDDKNNPFSKFQIQQRQDLPELQSSMLYNALRAVTVGGHVIYSTCTMSPTQNEAVVHTATLDAYRKYGIRTVCRQLCAIESHLTDVMNVRFHQGCRWGSMVLPYLPDNYGPMYVCKLERIE